MFVARITVTLIGRKGSILLRTYRNVSLKEKGSGAKRPCRRAEDVDDDEMLVQGMQKAL
jgi:hypothetical protein